MNPQRVLSIIKGRKLAITQVWSLVALLVVCFMGIASSTAQSPAKDEREMPDEIPAHVPIRVKVKNPEKVKDLKNEKWLGDLEVEITNTGTKPIYYLSLSLRLQDVRTQDGAIIGYQLNYGRAQLADLSAAIGLDDVPLRPGESCVLKVPVNSAKAWRLYKAEKNLPAPKKVRLVFQLLNHGDGTGFMGPNAIPLPNEHGCQSRSNKGDVASVFKEPPSSYSLKTGVSNLLPVNFAPAIFLSTELTHVP